MIEQLVPRKLLLKSNKILFVSHMAIGDFVYYRPFFIAFSKKYPHLRIDIWVDEVRRTYCFWKWNDLKRYSLYDWVRSSSLFGKVYDKTYSPFVLKESVKEAVDEGYPIVVSLGSIRKSYYANLSRSLSPNGFVVAAREKLRWFSFFKKLKYKKLNESYLLEDVFGHKHVTEDFSAIFTKLFGVKFDYKKFIYSSFIPSDWITYAKLKLLKWGYGPVNCNGKVVFINSFAKTHKRSWPMKDVMTLIESLKRMDVFFNAIFIVSCTPGKYRKLRKIFKDSDGSQMFLFTADTSFFQLPAIIAVSDLVVSVETSVIHLAAVLRKPVVALMRLKTPNWKPYGSKSKDIVWCKKRSDFIKDISVKRVAAMSRDFVSRKAF